MQALHTATENTSTPFSIVAPDERDLCKKYQGLVAYLDELSTNKGERCAEEHEAAIVGLVREIGQAALGELFANYDIESAMISANGQTYRRKHQSRKTYQSAFGPVRLMRHVYVNRQRGGDGKSICPLEMQAGFIGGYWSPLAAKQSAFALAHLTPQEVEDLLLQLGQMTPSRSSLDRLPKLLHQSFEPQYLEHVSSLMAEESVPKDTATVAVSLDGVMVGMKPGKTPENKGKKSVCEWREASCGTVSFFDNEGQRLSTIQYARMPEAKKVTLKALLQKQVDVLMKQQPNINLVHLADGAQDNWSFFDEHMPLGFQLTDFYHACQYLKSAFSAAYPQASKALDKFNHYKCILRDELKGINLVLRALRYLRQKQPHNPEINAAVTYFTNNQHRMRYAEAKHKNYPIGSGIVEAACKTLVGNRLKRSGMSWCTNGGQAILTWRAFAKSLRFDSAWKLVAKSFIKPVAPVAKVVNLFD